MKILGTVKIKPKNKWRRILQKVGLVPKSKKLVLDKLNCKRTLELCSLIKSLSDYSIDSTMIDLSSDIPIFINIVMKASGVELQSHNMIYDSINESWDYAELKKAVLMINEEIDYQSLVTIFANYGKIKAVGI